MRRSGWASQSRTSLAVRNLIAGVVQATRGSAVIAGYKASMDIASGNGAHGDQNNELALFADTMSGRLMPRSMNHRECSCTIRPLVWSPPRP